MTGGTNGAETSGALLSARGIEKRFGATRALRGVDFELRVGEVHALVGANGAGKSTLSRVIAGMIRPDAGSLSVLGREIAPANPRDALEAGIAMVTQETSLAPDLTAIENVFLPELGRSGRLDWRRLRQRAGALIDDLKIVMQFSLDTRVSDLSMANRQIVEILRVLALDSRVILLDEPTTSLSPYECDRLLELTQRLAHKGHGLVLVTHRMEEIFSFTDRLTVLREGSLVASSVETGSIDGPELIRLMVGRELRDVYAGQGRVGGGFAKTAFRALNLRVGNAVRDVSLHVGEGEILGLGGLVGAGRTEAAEAIFGLVPRRAGEMELFGRSFDPRSPIDAIRAGLGFVGEDRRQHGLVPHFSVRENLMLVHLSLQKEIGLSYGKVEKQAIAVVESLGLKAARLADANILKFSGGMQQKIILARWLLAKPKLLILDEPTRGVDIETRASIYKALRASAAAGMAIILISSDFEELLGLSDRVVVLSDGRSVAEVPAAYLDIERLTMLAAPRSSAGQIGQLLRQLAERYDACAVWIHRDADHIFCFDSASRPGVPPTLERGAFARAGDTPFADGATPPTGDPACMLVPILGKRGQGLGFIGLTVPPPRRLPQAAELAGLIRQALHPSQPAAA
ncbi:sugar ABC transporter ATP-binding protein [Labrys monachus]|uniref:ABC-type sugar transport system ATPase subunit n=1 Tax=Labrys monachus TaxID=217067 RepID=A0ABU0FEY2_9HYPH|nr:sugar ABC transporter ATP-binding protein [Labrys monachus]MDQ0393081.1 ABC-type sugar transport system ATPase subunit [Labrys monachus]